VADQTVLSLLSQLTAQMAALTQQVTALAVQDQQTAAALGSLRQLVSDTQIAVLHVQDTLGQPGNS
jgi:ClpP class serine protease